MPGVAQPAKEALEIQRSTWLSPLTIEFNQCLLLCLELLHELVMVQAEIVHINHHLGR